MTSNNNPYCWVCGMRYAGAVRMLAEVAQVNETGSGGRVVDHVFMQVEVCQPCATEARRRALRPLDQSGRTVAPAWPTPAYPR